MCQKSCARSVIEHVRGLGVPVPLLGQGPAPGAAGRRVVAEAAAAGAGVERRLGQPMVLIPIDRLARVLLLDPAVHLHPADRVRPGEALHVPEVDVAPVSYTHLRAHETDSYLVC